MSAFCACIVVGGLAVAFWPGGSPVVVPVAAAIAAFAFPVFIPWVLNRRNPHFGSLEEVERLLGLTVLAVYNAQSSKIDRRGRR